LSSPLYILALLVALGHALLPTHWLPFVLFGHAQRWSRRRVLGVALLAAGGHIAATTLLGLVAAKMGKETAEWIGRAFRPVAASLLVLGAVYFLARDLFAGRDSHSEPVHRAGKTGGVVALVVLLTFSPCEALVPAFFLVGPQGWTAFLNLALLVSAVTVAAILVLVAVAYEGAARVDLHRFERYEGRLYAGFFAVLAAEVIFLG
jgi:hypothetical protein